MQVKRKVELDGQGAYEFEVGVCFGFPKAVVEVCNVKNEAQFPALLMQCAEEGDGIGSAGDTDGQAQSGCEERGVEREDGMLRGGHETMIEDQLFSC
jgi:hypothetical protein